MKYGELRALRGWAEDGWNFPDLWLRSMDEGTGEKEINTEELVRNLLHGDIEPMVPATVWERLLTEGEFGAARRLLDNRKFLAGFPGRDHDDLLDELDKRQQARLRGLNTHVRLLMDRAHRVEYPLQFEPTFHRIKKERAGFAEERLEREEQKLKAREEQYYAPPPGSDVTFGIDCSVAWKEWDYDREPTKRLCAWALRGEDDLQRAPPDFQEHYRPDTGDLAATGLASSLLELVECPPPERGDQLRAFVHSFTNLLKNGPTAPPLVQDAGDYFITELADCSSPWLPALYACHGRNIPLIVPHTADAEITADGAGANFVCLLDIWKLKPKISAPFIEIETGWLFRLMGVDGERRLDNFHCLLGRAIPLSKVIPETGDDGNLREKPENLSVFLLPDSKEADMEIQSFENAYTLVGSFFRLHGIRVRHESDIARIARRSVGPVWIFRRYLKQLLRELAAQETGSREVDYQFIEVVWSDPKFLPSIDELLTPILDIPLARLLLFLALFESMTMDKQTQDDGIDIDTILDDLDNEFDEKREFSRDSINTAFKTLVEHGFIHMSSEKDNISLVENSVTILLVSQLDDADGIDGYIKDAVKKVGVT